MVGSSPTAIAAFNINEGCSLTVSFLTGHAGRIQASSSGVRVTEKFSVSSPRIARVTVTTSADNRTYITVQGQ
jgi:hypothetical protein